MFTYQPNNSDFRPIVNYQIKELLNGYPTNEYYRKIVKHMKSHGCMVYKIQKAFMKKGSYSFIFIFDGVVVDNYNNEEIVFAETHHYDEKVLNNNYCFDNQVWEDGPKNIEGHQPARLKTSGFG